MRVGLVDLDSKIPNLALMRLSAYHKGQGDEVVFPYDSRGADKVCVSTVFTRSRAKAELWASTGAEVGGTGWDTKKALPPEVEACSPDYSLYPEVDYSIGFTSRGCIRRCPFCFVPEKEGAIRSVATVPDLLRPDAKLPRAGNGRRHLLVLLDNNFLANPDKDARLEEIERLDLAVNFNQGLDIRLVDGGVAERLARVRASNIRRTDNTVHFAFDHPAHEDAVRHGVALLAQAGVKPYRLMFYILVGFNTTFGEDMYRFEVLRGLGVEPYVMIYNEGGTKDLHHFARWVNARLYRTTCAWEDYWPHARLKTQVSMFGRGEDGRG